MRLLITRPREDAERFAKLVTARGHVAIIAPVTDVRFREGPVIALDGVQAVLATSANGMRALSRRTPRRDVTIYAVGPQTAKAARDAGFVSVESADGDAAALTRFIAARARPDRGKLFHAAGAETAGRVGETLSAAGFTVETEVLYEVAQVVSLPSVITHALRDGTLDGVLLFSPRSARIFASLVAAANLSSPCAKLTAFCISAATAAASAPLTFAHVAIASTPNQDAMLALLPDSSRDS